MRKVTYTTLAELEAWAGLRCAACCPREFSTAGRSCIAFKKPIQVGGSSLHSSDRQSADACARSVRSIEQRVLLLRRGLKERVPRVRAASMSMLRTWLVDECGANVTALLRALDVESHEGAAFALIERDVVLADEHWIFNATAGSDASKSDPVTAQMVPCAPLNHCQQPVTTCGTGTIGTDRVGRSLCRGCGDGSEAAHHGPLAGSAGDRARSGRGRHWAASSAGRPCAERGGGSVMVRSALHIRPDTIYSLHVKVADTCLRRSLHAKTALS